MSSDIEELTLVSGLSCSGKTTFTSTRYPPHSVLHFDQISSRRLDRRVTESPTIKYIDGLLLSSDNLAVVRSSGRKIIVFFIFTDIMTLLERYTFPRTESEKRVFYTPEQFPNRIAVVDYIKQQMIIDLEKLKTVSSMITFWYARDNSSAKFEVVSEAEFKACISPSSKAIFESWVDSLSGAPRYQTLTVNGQIIRPGTEGDWKTWELVRDKVGAKFTSARVLDAGCFNGYFTIQAFQLGASQVTSVDIDERATRIARMHIYLNGYTPDVLQSDIHTYLKNRDSSQLYDVGLFLNFLHHLERNAGRDVIRLAISTIRTVVFEVNPLEGEFILHNLPPGKLVCVNVPTHRPGRSLIVVV